MVHMLRFACSVVVKHAPETIEDVLHINSTDWISEQSTVFLNIDKGGISDFPKSTA